MVVSSRAKIGPSTTVLITERAPHVSDIRNQNQVSESMLKDKVKEKEIVNAYNIKQELHPKR